MIEKLKVLPFMNKDTSLKEFILMLDRNHKDKVNALPINFKISLFMIRLIILIFGTKFYHMAFRNKDFIFRYDPRDRRIFQKKVGFSVKL